MARPEKASLEAVNRIRKMIQAGHYGENEKLPAEESLALEYGMGRNTIRKALKVLEAEGLISIIKNKGAFVSQSIPASGPQRIPFVSTSSQDGLFHNLFLGVQEFFKDKNCELLLMLVSQNADAEREKVEEVIAQGYKDIFVFSPQYSENELFYASQIMNGVNIVFIDRKIAPLSCNYVTSNNFAGGYYAAEELMNVGCQKYYYCVDSDLAMTYTSMQRFKGFSQKIKSDHPDADVEQIAIGEDEVVSTIEKIYEEKNEPVGIFCCSDYLAVKISNAMMSRNFYLPIIGFDNVFSKVSIPNITTVEQPTKEIGYTAAKVLYEHMYNRNSALCQYELPVKLIRQASTDKAYLKDIVAFLNK